MNRSPACRLRWRPHRNNAEDTAGRKVLKVNFHSHSRFCDGTDEPASYVTSAMEKGFTAFGFSGHAPLPFQTEWNIPPQSLPEYLQITRALKEKHAGEIDLAVGLETDWLPGCTDWRTLPGIDFTIGAVHFLSHPETGEPVPVDGNRKVFRNTLDTAFGGDIQAFGEAYYAAVRDMLVTMPPNILAHLDVFRKNNDGNRFFNEEEEWYREEVGKTLEVILLTDVIVEVNTGGMARGYVKEPYPSWWILEAILEAGIPILMSSDAHHPDFIDFSYGEVRKRLQDMGFTKQRALIHGIWQDVPL